MTAGDKHTSEFNFRVNPLPAFQTFFGNESRRAVKKIFTEMMEFEELRKMRVKNIFVPSAVFELKRT